MSTPRTLQKPSRLLLLLHHLRSLRNATLNHHPSHHRSFITLPTNAAPHELTAHRTLPYHHARLYELIADVDSYASFLPYCKSSRVTAWGAPVAHDGATGRRQWPTRGDLTAGWGAFEATYTSRVICVPALGVVEAISGPAARSGFSAAELARHGHGLADDYGAGRGSGGGGSGVFTSLVTRWTVVPDAARSSSSSSTTTTTTDCWSHVSLSIRYQFANPLYAAVSSAVADRVAPVMVEAFVGQARRVLGEPARRIRGEE
ncbi:hypothetical protein F4779DRAFT_614290 [Xylariaceae sp. FL0662B]|nr:hypothetical protein F4779DRAFT_614290 [Xylariaceae sp. FL0662B]